METIYRKIIAQTPIFTNYILTQVFQIVNTYFPFFDISVSVFPNLCQRNGNTRPPGATDRPLYRVNLSKKFTHLHIDFFLSIVYDMIAKSGEPIIWDLP